MDELSNMRAIMVRRAYRFALQEVGVSYPKLAKWFVTSESCVALRFGEVTGCPLALLTPQRVRVRGDEFVWPLDIRNSRISTMRRIALKDERRRVVVRVLT